MEFDKEKYPNTEITGKVIGVCMEVHRTLGHGFLEVVYKDALEREFKSKAIAFSREHRFNIEYKGLPLPHFYYADFVVCDSVILEVKAKDGIASEDIRQTLNYLSASKLKVGLIINFGESSLKFRRVIL